MEIRRLGKTGHRATILTLGGCGVGRLSQEEADAAIELALKHGLNMIDVAPTYGEAEDRLRPWVEKHRDRLFIAEKTQRRTREEAKEELNRSLERLGVAHFDLYQFHTIGGMDELEQMLGKDGAMEAFREAKETGLIRHIGITGHEDIRTLVKALELYDFDTVLAPINVASMANPHPANDFRLLLKIAEDRDIGVIAIKAISKGRWVGERVYGTWYQPLDDPREIDMALGYALSQEGVATYSLPCDVRLWPLVLDAAERYRRLDEQEQREVVEYASKHEFNPLFPP